MKCEISFYAAYNFSTYQAHFGETGATVWGVIAIKILLNFVAIF